MPTYRLYRPLGIALGLLIGLASSTKVNAEPISYAFSGTLSEPFNGSSTFSGTFTYNTDLPTYPGIQGSPGWSYYTGVPNDPTSPVVSLTFNLGGTASSSFGSIESLEVVVAHTQSSDGFFIQQQFSYQNHQNLTAEIGFSNDNTVQPAPFRSSEPPSSLSLPSFSIGGSLTLFGTTSDGQSVNVVGTVTSLTPIAAAQVPEPVSLLVFALTGMYFYRSRLRTRQDLS